jgi:hypothetical protein
MQIFLGYVNSLNLIGSGTWSHKLLIHCSERRDVLLTLLLSTLTELESLDLSLRPWDKAYTVSILARNIIFHISPQSKDRQAWGNSSQACPLLSLRRIRVTREEFHLNELLKYDYLLLPFYLPQIERIQLNFRSVYSFCWPTTLGPPVSSALSMTSLTLVDCEVDLDVLARFLKIASNLQVLKYEHQINCLARRQFQRDMSFDLSILQTALLQIRKSLKELHLRVKLARDDYEYEETELCLSSYFTNTLGCLRELEQLERLTIPIDIVFGPTVDAPIRPTSFESLPSSIRHITLLDATDQMLVSLWKAPQCLEQLRMFFEVLEPSSRLINLHTLNLMIVDDLEDPADAIIPSWDRYLQEKFVTLCQEHGLASQILPLHQWYADYYG